MKLKNCIECGALIVENPIGMCPQCIAVEETAEDKVAEFLRTVRRASVKEIEEATGVKLKVIMRMLKRGRLYNNDCLITYPCEICGEMITSGRMCEECTRNITSQLKGDDRVEGKPETKITKEGRMYIKDMIEKKK